jgi:restriction endonuclease Mrr
MKKQVETCRADITKFSIAHDVLEKLNQKKENHLRELHEVVRRVTAYEDFSICSPTVRLKAMELVAEVRQAADVKDGFTGKCIDTEMEAKKATAELEGKIQGAPPVRESIQCVTKELLAAFGESDAIRRAKILEGVLNRLFEVYGMLVRDSFAVKGACRDGIIEQIDGVVEMDGDPYLVEMKWLNKPIGTNEISPHLVRVCGRGTQARSVFISYSEYTEAAIETCKQALAGGALAALCRLSEIVAVVERHEQGADLRDMLRTKVHAALLYKKPWREYESAIH